MSEIKVKPLQWQSHEMIRGRFHSFGGLIRYTIARPGNEPDGTVLYRWAREGQSWSDVFRDVDAVKAAANADHARHVLAQIETA